MSDYEHIELTITDEVATLELRRPEKRNAMNPAMHRNLIDALSRADTVACKVLVVTGAGTSFSTGADLEQSFLEPFDDRARFDAIHQDFFDWIMKLKSFPGVTVARVNGWALGGGFELAAMCDIVIAADESIWGLSEINFGLFPGGGNTWAYSHNMPRKQALYYALTGETITGQEAVALGIATKSVPLKDLDSAVEAVVQLLTSKGRAALRRTKEVYERSIDLSLADSIEWETANLWELSRETDNDWIRTALESFSKREFKPGLKSYRLKRDV